MIKNKPWNEVFFIMWFLTWALLLIPFLFKLYLPSSGLIETYIFVSSAIALVLNLFFYIKVSKNKFPLKKLLLYLAIISVFLLIIPPLTSSDSEYYIYSARVFTEHGQNPYTEAYSKFTDDNFYNPISPHHWSHLTSTYGLLFTIICFFVTWAAKSSLILSLYLFKIITAIAFFSCSYLIYKITNSKRALFLFSFNPLIIFEFLVNSHNDVFMLLFILLAFYFIYKKPLNVKYAFLSILMLTLSALIKYTSVLLIPIFFLIICKSLRTKMQKFKFSLISVFINLFIVVIFYLPFWSKKIIERLQIQSDFYYTIIASPFIIIANKKINIKNDIIKYSTLTMLSLVLFFFTWMPPWYYIVLLALIFAREGLSKYNKEFLNLSYLFTFLAILNYLILR